MRDQELISKENEKLLRKLDDVSRYVLFNIYDFRTKFNDIKSFEVLIYSYLPYYK